MTAKQYLQQAFRLNSKIDAKIANLTQLRVLSTCIPSTSDLSQDKVQTSGATDRIGTTIAKIVDLEGEINAKIDNLIDLKREIGERIERMPDDDLRLILEKRYINFQKWEQIAIDLEFTFQWVHVLHNRALKQFENFLPVDSN